MRNGQGDGMELQSLVSRDRFAKGFVRWAELQILRCLGGCWKCPRRGTNTCPRPAQIAHKGRRSCGVLGVTCRHVLSRCLAICWFVAVAEAIQGLGHDHAAKPRSRRCIFGPARDVCSSEASRDPVRPGVINWQGTVHGGAGACRGCPLQSS